MQGLQNGVNATMLARQQAALNAQRQAVPGIAAAVSAGGIAGHNQSIVPHHMQRQSPGLLNNVSAAQFAQQPVGVKNNSVMMNVDTVNRQHLGAQTSLNDLHARSMAPNAGTVNPMMQFGTGRRDGGLQLPNGNIPAVGLGTNAAQYSMPPGGNVPATVAGLAHARHAFANSNPNVAANSEQMMESLLFGEGGMASAAPAGPPEFDF